MPVGDRSRARGLRALVDVSRPTRSRAHAPIARYGLARRRRFAAATCGEAGQRRLHPRHTLSRRVPPSGYDVALHHADAGGHLRAGGGHRGRISEGGPPSTAGQGVVGRQVLAPEPPHAGRLGSPYNAKDVGGGYAQAAASRALGSCVHPCGGWPGRRGRLLDNGSTSTHPLTDLTRLRAVPSSAGPRRHRRSSALGPTTTWGTARALGVGRRIRTRDRALSVRARLRRGRDPGHRLHAPGGGRHAAPGGEAGRSHRPAPDEARADRTFAPAGRRRAG
jgi:hypothetical protein